MASPVFDRPRLRAFLVRTTAVLLMGAALWMHVSATAAILLTGAVAVARLVASALSAFAVGELGVSLTCEPDYIRDITTIHWIYARDSVHMGR